MLLVQKQPFFQILFFRQYRPEKCLLRYSRTKKMPFLAIKTRSLKRLKIDIFLEWLTHGFRPKMAIFRTFFFRQYRLGKCLLRYSRTKKMSFQGIKTRSSKSLKIDIFLVQVQKWPFYQLFFFLIDINQENVFSDNLERKYAFLDYKNKKIKQFKN